MRSSTFGKSSCTSGRRSLRLALAHLLVGIDAEVVGDAESLDPGLRLSILLKIRIPVAAELIVEQCAWRVQVGVPAVPDGSAVVVNVAHRPPCTSLHPSRPGELGRDVVPLPPRNFEIREP